MRSKLVAFILTIQFFTTVGRKPDLHVCIELTACVSGGIFVNTCTVVLDKRVETVVHCRSRLDWSCVLCTVVCFVHMQFKQFQNRQSCSFAGVVTCQVCYVVHFVYVSRRPFC